MCKSVNNKNMYVHSETSLVVAMLPLSSLYGKNFLKTNFLAYRRYYLLLQ